MTMVQDARDFSDLTRTLLEADAEGLKRAGFPEAIAELAPLVGFDQRSPHHAYDLFTHVAKVVEKMPRDPVLRWAALLHDVGKIPTFTQDETGRGHFYGHASESARMADRIFRRLGAPDQLRQEAVALIGRHMTKHQPEADFLRSQLAELGWQQYQRLLILQEADMTSKGVDVRREQALFAQIRQILPQLRQDQTIAKEVPHG